MKQRKKSQSSVLPPTRCNVDKAEKKLRKILNRAAKHNIPTGTISEILPEIPTEAANKIRERDDIRKSNPNSERIHILNKEISGSIKEHRRSKWREFVETIDRKTNSSKLFRTIKKINGKPTASPNQSIFFGDKELSNPQKIANHFNKQFASAVKHTSSKLNRITNRKISKSKITNPPTFSAAETSNAIKKCKSSKALGPDQLSNLHLKHLGEHGIAYLTKIFNLSLATSNIPEIWKHSNIIPLLKPNKDQSSSQSFRPVSLLCPAVKIFEKLLSPLLDQHLPIPDFQHGFRSDHSTVTALQDFSQDIANGFNKNKPPDRTVLLQIDLSKAFDMVDHNLLLTDIWNSTLPTSIKRWFKSYLHGRQSKVKFRNSTSKARNIRAGVPQGAVTSPKLFNFYLKDLQGIKVIQYADDISIYMSGTDIDALSRAISDYAKVVIKYLTDKKLKVSPSKSTVTLFTPDTKQVKIKPEIFLDDTNTAVELERTPKLLGVYFDSMYTFSHNAKQSAHKAKSKTNVLKALAGTDWGQDKESLLIAYKASCRSVLEYAAPIWAPALSDTNWECLQRVQNQALRVASGCIKMTGIDHLHQETKVLPLKPHSQMLSKQFLAACYKDKHPGKKHTVAPPSKRNLKHTILQYKEEVENWYSNDTSTISRGKYKLCLANIHSATVEECMTRFDKNRVLDAPPPPIDKEEISLDRKSRTLLSQLRSGFSTCLNSYKARIDPTTLDNCPACSQSPHDVTHLFNCPSNPTDLSPIDLWHRPKMAAAFLNPHDVDDDDNQPGSSG